MKHSKPGKLEQRHLTYIMSPSYSGSTLLTLLLADHPDIATVGELKASAMGDISTYYCSCGELLTACPFWDKVQQMMLGQGRKLSFDNFNTHFQDSKNPLSRRLFRAALRGPVFEAARKIGFLLSSSARETKQKIILQNQALIDITCTLQQAETFLDDSKDPTRLKFLLEADLWNIRAIHLIRDGRGVTNSYMRHQQTTMAEAAREWVHTQQECDRMAGILGSNRCLTVHYENLCLEPEKVLAAIYDFLGLPQKTNSISTRIKHIMGNQMRLGSLQDIRLDEKWKQTLTADDLQIFADIAGELNHLHGYK
jgi:hypothetical protein